MKIEFNTVINTERFKLRPFTDADAIPFANSINTPTIERDTTINLPWSLDSVSWWISFIRDAASRRPLTEFHFIIEIDGQIAGSIGVINIFEHRAEVGYWLADKYHGQGIMTEVVKVVSEYSFKNTPVRRIFAPILPHNKASARVLEKNGYMSEGVLRKYYSKKGKYIDAVCYSLVL